jgi:hypothetical protein
MERFWNIVHYFAYRAHYNSHLLFNRINPVLLFYRLPFARKHFEKMGVDPEVEVNKTFERPDTGLSSIFAGGLMYSLIVLLCFGIADLYEGLFQTGYHLTGYHFVGFVALSFVTNYFLLFKRDKYIRYFKKFDKMEKADRKRWAWISFGVILGILLFAVSSFLYMAYREPGRS